MMSDLETYIVSVERIKEYTVLNNEAAWDKSSHKPRSDWPHHGEVIFKNYSTRSGYAITSRVDEFHVN